MSSVSAISSASSTGFGGTDATASRIPQKVLGQNDFLQLLATQFKSQDPMKPMEDTAFIAQMAQFTALEQSSTMAKEMAQLRGDQLRVAANSYLGHRVTVNAGDGKLETGNVVAVDASGDEPAIIVNNKPYSLSAVLRVEPGVVTAPQPTTTGGA